MDNIELSIKAYMQARKRLQHGYEKYIMLCKNAGPNTVMLLESVEPFAALNEAIYWGISLYERKIKHPDDFMSGIKYISNANQGLKAREGGRKTAQKSRECKYVANKSHNTLLRCLRQ